MKKQDLIQQLPTMDIYKTQRATHKVLTAYKVLFFRYKGAVLCLVDCRPSIIEGYDLQYPVTATAGLLLNCTFEGSLLLTVSVFIYTEPGARTMTTTFKKARETVEQLKKLMRRLRGEELETIKTLIKEQINP